jgi:hypothetical protein
VAAVVDSRVYVGIAGNEVLLFEFLTKTSKKRLSFHESGLEEEEVAEIDMQRFCVDQSRS